MHLCATEGCIVELLVPSSLPHVGEGVYIIRPSGPVDVRGDEIWLGPSSFLTGRSHKQTEKFLAESCMKIRKKLSCFFSAGAGFSSRPDGWRLSVVWCCGPRQRSRDHEMPGQEQALREVRTDRNRPQLTPCSRAVPGRDETWVGACPRQRQERTSWVGAREQATMRKLDQGLSLLFYTIDSSRTSRTVGELSCAGGQRGVCAHRHPALLPGASVAGPTCHCLGRPRARFTTLTSGKPGKLVCERVGQRGNRGLGDQSASESLPAHALPVCSFQALVNQSVSHETEVQHMPITYGFTLFTKRVEPM